MKKYEFILFPCAIRVAWVMLIASAVLIPAAEPTVILVPTTGVTPAQSVDTWVEMSGKHDGAADLSASFTLERIPAGVTLAITVHDDHHVQEFHGFGTWQGDSVQLAIQTLPADDPDEASSYALALTDTGPELVCHALQDLLNNRPFETAQTTITRVDAQTLIYHVNVPISQASAGKEFGLSLLINDNDGQGRKGYLHWGGDGIGHGLNPKKFGRFRLAP